MIREKIWEILAKAKTLYQKKKCWLNVGQVVDGSNRRVGGTNRNFRSNGQIWGRNKREQVLEANSNS